MLFPVLTDPENRFSAWSTVSRLKISLRCASFAISLAEASSLRRVANALMLRVGFCVQRGRHLIGQACQVFHAADVFQVSLSFKLLLHREQVKVRVA